MENNFKEYPFEVNGIQFVSRIRTGSSYDMKTMDIPRDIFDAFNRQAIQDLVGNPTEYSREALMLKMLQLNENGSDAFLELVV